MTILHGCTHLRGQSCEVLSLFCLWWVTIRNHSKSGVGNCQTITLVNVKLVPSSHRLRSFFLWRLRWHVQQSGVFIFSTLSWSMFCRAVAMSTGIINASGYHKWLVSHMNQSTWVQVQRETCVLLSVSLYVTDNCEGMKMTLCCSRTGCVVM